MTITMIADILDAAMYEGIELLINTKSRGDIRGIPENVDEFDSDPNRLGYCFDIGNDTVDTVFLDEVVSISEILPIKTPADLKTVAV